MRSAAFLLGALFASALAVALLLARHRYLDGPHAVRVHPAATWTVVFVLGVATLAAALSAAGSYSRAEIALIAQAAAWEVETYPGAGATPDVVAAVVMHGNAEELRVSLVDDEGALEHWQITNDEGGAAVCLHVRSVYAAASAAGAAGRTFEAEVTDAACE